MAEAKRLPEPYRDFRIGYLIHVCRQPGERHEIASSNDITFVHEGEFTYIVDGEPLTIRAGEAYFCPSGALRERRACAAPVVYTSINFVYAGGDMPLPLARRVKHTRSAELDATLRRMLAAYEAREPLYRERTNALLALIVCELLRLNPPGAETAPPNPYVEEMKRLITADLSRRVNVEEIADAVHLYPTYCSELFRRETGVTISEWASSARVEAAKALLADASMSIREIAERTGFCDRFYFSRVFRQKTGISPTDYRQSVKEIPPLPSHRVETKLR